MNIKTFETKIGMVVEELDEEKLISVIKNPDNIEFFKETKTTLDILDCILERNKNETFLKEVLTLKHSTEMIENERLLNNVFEDYRDEKITREKLIEELRRFLDSSDPKFVISTIICMLIALGDIDLSGDIELIKSNIEKFKNIFDTIGKIEKSYQLRCDLIDLMYILRTKFFELYNIELEMNWVDTEVDRIDEFTSKLLEEHSGSSELPEIDIKPEELGFIDITKLNKE